MNVMIAFNVCAPMTGSPMASERESSLFMNILHWAPLVDFIRWSCLIRTSPSLVNGCRMYLKSSPMLSQTNFHIEKVTSHVINFGENIICGVPAQACLYSSTLLIKFTYIERFHEFLRVSHHNMFILNDRILKTPLIHDTIFSEF